MATYFVLEASHLFRAGDKHKTQFFVSDVVAFLRRSHFPDEDFHVIVLHGSTKEEQATRYANALKRQGIEVIRMTPIPSLQGNGKHFYKPTYYIHQMMGKQIPAGSTVVLIGFHNLRYLSFLQKYSQDFKLSVAAFTTPSRRQGALKIPTEFQSFIQKAICLDSHVADIKNEWKKKK